MKEIWGINKETREWDWERLGKREGEKDIWQTLLKAFQKAFAVVDTFGSSLLHLKVTNAFHYTSKRSFSETSYCLFSHSLSLPPRLWSDPKSVVHVLPVIALGEARSSQISNKIKSICWVKVGFMGLLWHGKPVRPESVRKYEVSAIVCFRPKQISIFTVDIFCEWHLLSYRPICVCVCVTEWMYCWHVCLLCIRPFHSRSAARQTQLG